MTYFKNVVHVLKKPLHFSLSTSVFQKVLEKWTA